MHSRKHSEPASDVFFTDGEGFACKQHEWIEDGAPGDLIFVDRVVEVACADRVFGQEQRAVVGAPNRERPISDELGKAASAPLFVSRRDNGNVRGADSQGVSQFADQLGSVVQATIPGDHDAGRRDVRLCFSMRFLCGPEGAIEDC